MNDSYYLLGLDVFDDWCSVKKYLSISNKTLLFKEKEIWWASVGKNIGSEINGKNAEFTRPVLVYKKLNHSTFVCIPVTSKEKTGNWYSKINIKGQDRWLCLNQIKMLDSKRLQKRICTVPDNLHEKIKLDLRNFLQV